MKHSWAHTSTKSEKNIYNWWITSVILALLNYATLDSNILAGVLFRLISRVTRGNHGYGIFSCEIWVYITFRMTALSATNKFAIICSIFSELSAQLVITLWCDKGLVCGRFNFAYTLLMLCTLSEPSANCIETKRQSYTYTRDGLQANVYDWYRQRWLYWCDIMRNNNNVEMIFAYRPYIYLIGAMLVHERAIPLLTFSVGIYKNWAHVWCCVCSREAPRWSWIGRAAWL